VGGRVAGWAAMSLASTRTCYAGVAETSIYIGDEFRGRGVGTALIAQQVRAADDAGVWTLQTSIFPENPASLRLHTRAGFRTVGVRERIGQLHGVWRDTVLMERRRPDQIVAAPDRKSGGSMGRKPAVAVVGPGTDVPDELLDEARDVGRLLAQRGAIVITGGLGGVMAAASHGAREAGGEVIGLLPGRDRASANEHVTIAIATGLGQARNALVVASADAVISVGGSWGTLSEIALAHRAGTPVVCLRGWQITDDHGHAIAMTVAGSAEDAVRLAVG